MAVVFIITLSLPYPGFWHNQSAYQTVLGFTPRLVAASLTAYLFGEFSNTFIYPSSNCFTRDAGYGFAPDGYCIESKSLKLYLWSFRDKEVFYKALAGEIAQDVFDSCQPHWCTVTVTQKPRGGITITTTARVERESAGNNL